MAAKSSRSVQTANVEVRMLLFTYSLVYHLSFVSITTLYVILDGSKLMKSDCMSCSILGSSKEISL